MKEEILASQEGFGPSISASSRPDGLKLELFEERYHNEMDDEVWLRKAARMNNRDDLKDKDAVLGEVLKQELEKEIDLPLLVIL